MISGCLKGFLFSVLACAVIIFFTGGDVDMEALFTCAFIWMVIYAIISWIASFFKND